VDEAYYWTWSKEGAISFLDHPPLIAWFIQLSTALLGDNNFGVRFPACSRCWSGRPLRRTARQSQGGSRGSTPMRRWRVSEMST